MQKIDDLSAIFDDLTNIFGLNNGQTGQAILKNKYTSKFSSQIEKKSKPQSKLFWIGTKKKIQF